MATDTDARSLAANVEISTLVLHECSLKWLEDAGAVSGGEVESDFSIDPGMDDDDIFFYVRSLHRFLNETGVPIIEIRADFYGQYALQNGFVPTRSEVAQFGESSFMLHALPYIRELLATLTNRAGLPPFLMPIFRAAPGGS